MSFLCHYVILKMSDIYLNINKIVLDICRMSLENKKIDKKK